MLLKRPIITIFIVYSLFLVISDVCGLFLPTNQSFLYYLSSYYRNVEVEGRVISLVQSYGWGSTFVMETKRAGGAKVVEKVLVSLPRAYKVDYGDNIVLWGRLSIPQKAPFPLVFDYQNFLARDEIYVLMRADSCEFISSAPNLIMKFAFYVREDIVNKIDKYLKKGTADLLKPLIIGDKSGLDNPTKTLFMDAGLTHILVVSGLNVGFVAALFIAIFKFAGIPLRKRFIVVIPLIFLYVLATGANPPVLRAGIMTTCFLISLSVQREPLIYNSLALSALIILIFTPQQLFTASFQMSYAATIAIVYFYKKFYVPFSKVRNRFLKILIGAFCATTAAQVTMIPISAYYFGQFSLVSFISNTVIVPLVGFITTLGFVFYILTFISKFL
ncbi:MAG: ComEC family competence protein, partial [Elusimicrobiota bacterium]|nr:ComEC family competence protein [Elusimicrobiota bacterium]